MKVRTRRNNGFRPITVKIRFDNLVEYECFRALMSYGYIVRSISNVFTGAISLKTGVILGANEVEQCLSGVLKRIYKHLPEGKEAKQCKKPTKE